MQLLILCLLFIIFLSLTITVSFFSSCPLLLLILLHVQSPDHRKVLSVSNCADVTVKFCRLYRRQDIAEEEKEDVLPEDATTTADSGQTEDRHDVPHPYSCHGPPGRKYRHGGFLLRTVHSRCHTLVVLEPEVTC